MPATILATVLTIATCDCGAGVSSWPLTTAGALTNGSSGVNLSGSFNVHGTNTITGGDTFVTSSDFTTILVTNTMLDEAQTIVSIDGEVLVAPAGDANLGYGIGVRGVARMLTGMGGIDGMFGIYGLATNSATSFPQAKYAVFGKARGTGTNWAGYFDGNTRTVGTNTSDFFVGNGSGLLFTNANGSKFSLIVNAATNGFLFAPQ